MNSATRFLALCVVALFTLTSCDAKQGTSDNQKIETSLRSMFETPDNPLHLQPVVAVSDYAVVGWIQGDRGGRAFLRKKGDVWSVVLCSGKALMGTALLKDMGTPAPIAEKIATQVAAAEASMTDAQRTLLSSFGETLMIDGEEGHHGEHHGHP
jgi:hypothetical protein